MQHHCLQLSSGTIYFHIVSSVTSLSTHSFPLFLSMYMYVADDSTISGPMKLRSYYAVAEYSDAKSKFSFPEGAVVQVLQKDASGRQQSHSPRLHPAPLAYY